MRHALAVVVAFVLVLASGGESRIAGQGRATTQGAGPGTDSSPSRLLIALPPDAAATEGAGLVDLVGRLHLADPAATVIAPPPDAAATEGPFRVVVGAPTQAATTVRVRVETASGSPLSVDLPATEAPTKASDAQVAILEVLGGADGVTAWRTGLVALILGELRLPMWDLPGPGVDAVMLDGAWWTLVSDTTTAGLQASGARPPGAALRARLAHAPVSRMERLVDASLGDVTGDGVVDLAISFRRPFRRTLLNVSRPRRAWVDADGRSAHVGLFRPRDLSSIWVAGTLLRPVRRLAACTGGIAVAYSTLRRSAVVATSAWAWQGFGFLPLPELPGPGRPTCNDIDHDGRPDAAIIERG